MDTSDTAAQTKRVIKRYSNRKLYDTRDSRYVTLLQIAEMVHAGEDVQIIDNTTKEDKTEATLALAISEALKTKPRAVPLATLRNLIQERGEKLLTSLRDGPIGRLIPTAAADGKEVAKETKEPEPEQAAPAPEAPPATGPRVESRLNLSELVASSRHTIDQWQHAIDERVGAVIPGLSHFLDLQSEVRRLNSRVAELEQRIEALEGATKKAPESCKPLE